MSGFKVTHAPHVRAKDDGAAVMCYTILALLPALAAGVYFFGTGTLRMVFASIFAALLTEVAMVKLRGKEAMPADIWSAFITGMILPMTISPFAPWWMCALGSAFAVSIVKHCFGGLGFNIFNPALAARAFLLASWPVAMTIWRKPFDAVTSASTLAQVKTGVLNMSLSGMQSHVDTYWQFLIGNRAGSLGETSSILLILGGLFLLYKHIIDWRIPVSFIGSVAFLSAVFGQDPLFQVMAGGLLLGAFFMATDPVTKPMGRSGRWIFGLGCGAITIVIRFLGGYPEGVCYAILIMNGFTPLIDRYVIDRKYGYNVKRSH